MYINADLHIHSIYSDGEDSPADIAELALKSGVSFMSVTDHDSIDGIKELETAGKKLGIEILSGVELSCSDNKNMHILGYGFDYNNQHLLSKLHYLRKKRLDRIDRIVTRLNSIGIEITSKDILNGVEEDQSAGRVHIAKVLVRKGVVESVSNAFEKYLAVGKIAYEPSEKLTPKDAIELIKQAGGKAVLAHPYLLKFEQEQFIMLIKSLAKYGLNGIEADYIAHNTVEKSFYRAVADRFSLICTCGSDYHGRLRQMQITPQRLDIKAYEFLRS